MNLIIAVALFLQQNVILGTVVIIFVKASKQLLMAARVRLRTMKLVMHMNIQTFGNQNNINKKKRNKVDCKKR